MDEVTIRELRNRGGIVIDRLGPGEAVAVTRDGEPVAELRRLGSRPLTAAELKRRYEQLPRMDYDELRADLDATLDPWL